MSHVRNSSVLGVTPARRDALAMLDAALDAIDTEKVIQRSVSVMDDSLIISGNRFDLNKFKRIHVIGFGKPAAKAAEALEQVLGDRLHSGIVIGATPANGKKIVALQGTHPRPSHQNVQYTKRLILHCKDMSEDDLVIVIVSGGGSAMLCWPMTECDQGQQLYQDAISHGLTIHELNTVRKHISQIKGGGLAEMLWPTHVIGLVFSDVPGPAYHMVASGPTYRDTSTIDDAQKILDRYGLRGYELTETPKEDKFFERVTNMVLVSNAVALSAMAEQAKQLGYRPAIVADHVYSEPRDVIQMLKDYNGHHDVLLAGGEFRLVVPKQSGKGGRNTNAALTALEMIASEELFIAFASDGLDNTDAAGAIVDEVTQKKTSDAKLDITDFLNRYDDYTFFEKTGDLIFTGPTGANVSDLMMLLKKS